LFEKEGDPVLSEIAGTIPLSHPVKLKIKDALVSLSLANLCFLKVSFSLLSDYDRFFFKLPVTPPMLWAFAVNMCLLTAFFWLVMQLLRRFQNKPFHMGIHFLFFFLLLYPADFIRIKALSITDVQIYNFAKQPVMLLCEAVLLVFLMWQHRLVAKIAAVCVGILSPLAIFLLVKMALVCAGVVQLQTCGAPPPPPPLLPVRAEAPRVLWIIFDETDYRLAFEQRPANVQLPEFDRLRNEALNSTMAYPPGDGTILSMPSLIVGERVSSTEVNNSCDALLTFADSGIKADWSGLPSVFSKARGLGFNTALVGWYLPYTRMIGGSLNYCSWYSYPAFEPPRSAKFSEELAIQLSSFGETYYVRRNFVEMQRHALQDALSVAGDSNYNLTLLHMPTPHRPGIWLPAKKKFTTLPMNKVTGYMNNLMLADYELGEIRKVMEKSGLWEKTWVIMSSDHSWRESHLYDNVRDLRVPFLVKAPGTNQPVNYSTQFNTVLTRDLILSVLQGQITNQQNVVDWLDVHSPAQHDIPTAGSML
jgi:hypothetical protein